MKLHVTCFAKRVKEPGEVFRPLGVIFWEILAFKNRTIFLGGKTF